MFSLPIGNNEKKGTMPDLEKKSSEIDYGVISYFLPKSKTPCGYRLIAGKEVVGCIVQSGKKKNYVGAKNAIEELKKLNSKNKLSVQVYAHSANKCKLKFFYVK